MKFLLTFLFTFFLFTFDKVEFAYASTGELVGSVHYMDDRGEVDQKLSPFVGLEVSETCPWMKEMSAKALIGVGHVPQAKGSDADSEYARLALDVYYQLSDWKIGAGGGFESNKDVYRAWDDYVHLSVSKPLW